MLRTLLLSFLRASLILANNSIFQLRTSPSVKKGTSTLPFAFSTNFNRDFSSDTALWSISTTFVLLVLQQIAIFLQLPKTAMQQTYSLFGGSPAWITDPLVPPYASHTLNVQSKENENIRLPLWLIPRCNTPLYVSKEFVQVMQTFPISIQSQ